MRLLRALALSGAVLIVALTVPALAEDEARGSDALCEKAKSVALPKPDAAANVPKDCDSEDLYYGIGRPVDVVAARACALRHLADNTAESPMEGAGMLATIYANGKGAPRNYDIAIAYACQIQGAPAEMEGRMNHLAQLRKDGPGKTPFDICDDITSGLMMGFCADRASGIETAKRDAKLATLGAKLDAAHKASYDKLLRAEKMFAETLGDNEVDQSGTARAAMTIEARDEHHDAFVATLESALAGKLPAASEATFATADKALNATYAKVMARKEEAVAGTVEKKGIKTTQRAWLAYRDAFMAFVKDGPTKPQSIATVLTEQRTKDLTIYVE